MAAPSAFDAVVVGAGAGGAAAAWRMTQRGWRVLLLDAGPAFDPDTDYGLERNDWEKDRFRHKPGSLGDTAFAPMQLLDPALDDLRSWSLGQGPTNRDARRAVSGPGYHHVRGIGGSTLHFVGEAHRMHPASMAMKSRFGVAADWPVSYAELEPLYVEVERLLGRSISFTDFLFIGLPITVVLLPLCWALLVYVCYPGVVTLGADVRRWLLEQRAALGPIASGESRTLALFALVAASWLFREPKTIGAVRVPGLTDALPGLTDGSVGVACAILLFVVSGRSRSEGARPLLTWPEAVRIPWGVLLLFGGGLSLAAALEASTLTARAEDALRGLEGLPPWIVLLVVATTVLVLSELASNTAVAAMALPLAASLAPAVSQPPLLMMLVVAFAASTGFALPIATPPNAIVFGSGQVTTRQMLRAGIPLDAIAIVVIVALVSWLAPR